MCISYKNIYEKCLAKCEKLDIAFDFDNNVHLQSAQSLDDVYKNLVYHSQNRSQGCAFNFCKYDADGVSTHHDNCQSLWDVIESYDFHVDDKYDYLRLFDQIKGIEFVDSSITLEKGKDIQYLGLAKTCQCIRKYLNGFSNLSDFISRNRFSENADRNWNIVESLSDQIYNMGTELVPDFFKEQRYIEGREFLIKADVHVKRFFEGLYDQKLTDKQVYKKMLELYAASDEDTKRDIKPYKIDKLIYLIGEKLGNPTEMVNFAKSCR